ncbi:ABC transporter permease [Christensenella timonensis]|uniref:ABC transporter permease n=1 Tax=Christensenella timonensis TaxID=1816678 RepID=UPI0008359CAF|nr:ABC transporter permease [Christensenella timonensis]
MKDKISLKKITSIKNFPSIMILVVMIIITACLQNNFFTLQGLVSTSNAFFPLILMTIGQSVIMISGAVDLSNGAALSLMTCVLAATMKAGDPSTSITAIVLVVITAAVCGLLNGFAIGFMRVPPVIVTFATSYIFMGAGLFILPRPGGECVNWVEGFYNFSMVNGMPEWIQNLGNVIPPSLWILIAVIVIWMLISRTRFGRYLYATGGNEESAYASGINTARTRILACMFNSFCIMLTALFFVAQNRSGDYTLGDAFTLKSIAAAVIGGVSMAGGRGDIASAVIGALIFSFVNKIIFFANLPTVYQTLVSGLIVIVALMVSFVYTSLNQKAKLKEAE